jgi:hypothetical protein
MEKNRVANGAGGHDSKNRRRGNTKEIRLHGVIAPPRGHFVKERLMMLSPEDEEKTVLPPMKREKMGSRPRCHCRIPRNAVRLLE